MSSLRGHLLVAVPYHPDRNLAETVILVVEHLDCGAFGVVLNGARQQSDRIVGEGIVQRRFLESTTTYSGGPVAGPLMAVHTDESVAEVELFPGGYFAVNEETIKALREQTDQPCRVFTGYVGWEGRRLGDEVQQGLWRIVPATAEAVFSESDDLWERLLRQAFPLELHDLLDPQHISANPSVN
jgi:putative transcriptional regulator